MRQRYSFSETAYASKLLREPVRTDLGRLAAKLAQGRVVPISGSGLSAGPPTGLPSGVRLGTQLATWARGKGLASKIEALGNPEDLGDVAEVIEDHLGRDVLIRQLLEMVPWRRVPFNLGHLAIALMFAEEWISFGFTANWDALVLAAADTLECPDLACPVDVPTLQTSSIPVHVHVHGRVDAPASLVATTRDLAKPAAVQWTEPQLQGALTMGEPMLVGFAVEPTYIVETLEKMLGVMQASPAAVISMDSQPDFVAKSSRLAAAAQITRDSGPYVQGSATELLGEVIRHRYAEQLVSLLDEAERRASQVQLAQAALSLIGTGLVRDLLLNGTLSALLALLWKGAVLATNDGAARQPILRSSENDLPDALATLMILASCKDVSSLSFKGEAIRVLYGTKSVDVWIALPRVKSQVTGVVGTASMASAYFTRPGDDDIPLVLICAHTFGVTPPGAPSLLRTAAAGSSPAGLLTAHQREPKDVLTIDELDRRCGSLVGPGAPSLEEIVRL